MLKTILKSEEEGPLIETRGKNYLKNAQRTCLTRIPAVMVTVWLAAASLVAQDGGHPNRVIFLHYDYMVSTDPENPHSDEPRPETIELLKNVFRDHGITLVIDPRHTELPHSTWLGFDADGYGCSQVLAAQQGGTVASFAQLKSQYFHPTGNVPWHYIIFGHIGGIFSIGCTGTTGQAELPGYDFMVTVAGVMYDPRVASFRCDLNFTDICLRMEAGTLMHELGHNLDLRHGGGDDENFKPNYFSVMNYMFQMSGVIFLTAPRVPTFDHWELDYSEKEYPTLDESHLNERLGIGGSSDDRLVGLYGNIACGDAYAFATGPVDWNCNGVIEPDVAIDLNTQNFWPNPDFPPHISIDRLTGFNDWEHVRQFIHEPPYTTGRARPNSIQP